MLIHRDLLDWQWKGYAQAHQDRANLLIHLATVPLFWVGALLLLVAIATVMPVLAAGLPVLWLVALVAQAKGHRREVTAAPTFLGPIDFIVRLLAEQFITFPRYVLSGSFLHTLTHTSRKQSEQSTR